MRRNQQVVLGLGLAGLMGCSAEGLVPGGAAELSVVGPGDILLGSGWEHEIEVRYQSPSGRPLAGEVEFRLTGDVRAASLTNPIVHTDDNGIARTTIRGGTRDGEITVHAEAERAESVDWEVEVAASSPPLRISGEYVVESNFVPLRELPYPVERAVGVFEAMTEGEHAPAGWIIDEIMMNLENEGIRRAVEDFRPQLDYAVYQAIRETAPEFHDELREVGMYLDEAARHVGATTVLQIGTGSPSGIERTGPVATHTVTGMGFQVDGVPYDYAMGLGTDSARTSSVRVSALGREEMEIGAHELSLRYGGMLVAALEQVILPRVVSQQTTDLGRFFRLNVDCNRVGEVMHQRVLEGSATMFRTLCEEGTDMAAELVVQELLSLDDDEGVSLDVVGYGLPYDNDRDQIVERITGTWSGAFRRGDTYSRLDGGASEFHARRVEVR